MKYNPVFNTKFWKALNGRTFTEHERVPRYWNRFYWATTPVISPSFWFELDLLGDPGGWVHSNPGSGVGTLDPDTGRKCFARRKWTAKEATVWFELFQEESIGIMTSGAVGVSRREWAAAIRPDKETKTD